MGEWFSIPTHIYSFYISKLILNNSKDFVVTTSGVDTPKNGANDSPQSSWWISTTKQSVYINNKAIIFSNFFSDQYQSESGRTGVHFSLTASVEARVVKFLNCIMFYFICSCHKPTPFTLKCKSCSYQRCTGSSSSNTTAGWCLRATSWSRRATSVMWKDT